MSLPSPKSPAEDKAGPSLSPNTQQQNTIETSKTAPAAHPLSHTVEQTSFTAQPQASPQQTKKIVRLRGNPCLGPYHLVLQSRQTRQTSKHA